MSSTTITEERISNAAIRHGPPRAGRWATGWRFVVGLFYLGSAVFNLMVTFPNARVVYEAFAELAWPVAETLVRSLILPVAGVFTVAVVLFELAAGLMILHRGRVAHWGLMAAVAWLVGLIPFLGWYGTANVVLVVAILPLTRQEPDRSLVYVVSRLAERLRLRTVGAYQLMIGVGVIGWWTASLATGSVPEITAGDASIWFHLAAEGLMALLLIAGGWLLLRARRTGPAVSAVGLGSLVYSAVNSAGYFAEMGDWTLVAFFSVVLFVSLIAVLRVMSLLASGGLRYREI